jgi:uncharacterized RDD family membrane protein YckC
MTTAMMLFPPFGTSHHSYRFILLPPDTNVNIPLLLTQIVVVFIVAGYLYLALRDSEPRTPVHASRPDEPLKAAPGMESKKGAGDTAPSSQQEAPSPQPAPNLSTHAPAGPWLRFFARHFDLWWETCLVGFILVFVLVAVGLADWIENSFLTLLLGIPCLPLALLLDGALYGIAGNTPGKAFLGLRVTAFDGSRLSIAQYLARNFRMWSSGLAFGIPILNLYAFAEQSNRVGSGQPASYDAREALWVLATPLTRVRKVTFGLVFVGMFVAMGLLREADSRERASRTVAGLQRNSLQQRPTQESDLSPNEIAERVLQSMRPAQTPNKTDTPQAQFTDPIPQATMPNPTTREGGWTEYERTNLGHFFRVIKWQKDARVLVKYRVEPRKTATRADWMACSSLMRCALEEATLVDAEALKKVHPDMPEKFRDDLFRFVELVARGADLNNVIQTDALASLERFGTWWSATKKDFRFPDSVPVYVHDGITDKWFSNFYKDVAFPNFVRSRIERFLSFELTETDVVPIQAVTADTAFRLSVFGVTLGMTRAEVQQAVARRGFLKLTPSEHHRPYQSGYWLRNDRGEQLVHFIWRNDDDSLAAIILIDTMQQYLVGASKRLLSPEAATARSGVIRSFLGEPDWTESISYATHHHYVHKGLAIVGLHTDNLVDSGVADGFKLHTDRIESVNVVLARGSVE